jgi:hypothetical protein
MTPREVFALVLALEKDIADFYEELGRTEGLKPFADIFSYMSDHSQQHARQVEKAATAAVLPELDPSPIETLHRRIEESLRSQVPAESDAGQVMAQLARAEEVVGQLYASIAEHFRKRAAALEAIAGQFEQLSREEMAHRDFILDRQGD